MKILLAEPDRDMLMTYGRLLESEGYDVVRVFDGVQAVERLKSESFDLAVIGRRIPRINCRDIVKMFNENSTPSIVLLDKAMTPAVLLEPDAASSYMNYPFFPHELLFRVKNVLHRACGNEKIELDGIVINANKFASGDGTRFTNDEIDIIRSVLREENIDTHGISSYINSINKKLEQLKRPSRLEYVLDKGYRLVKINE